MKKTVLLLGLLFLSIMAKAQPVIINYPAGYELRHLIVNDPYYVDKTDSVIRIPAEIDRYLWLRTRSSDLGNTSNNFLAFTLRDSMTVYIAYDYKCWDPPQWLQSEFVNTMFYISVNDGYVKSYYLWKKSFPPGKHILGGNRAGGSGTSSRGMYLVLFATKSAAVPEVISPADGATNVSSLLTRFTWHNADAALNYYIKISNIKSNSGVFYSEWNLTDTTHTVSILQPYQTYYWGVQAENETSKSGFTSWNMFSTIPGEAPHANFSANPTSGAAPLNVQFTNLSTGMYTSTTWNFGDGQSSTHDNPMHVYASAGAYEVTLTVSGDLGSNQMAKPGYIIVAEKPVAAFIGNPTSGIAPLQVIFLDQSTGPIDSRLWTFGDGASSTEQNPIHVYQNSGTYTVTLVVTGPGGTSEKSAPAYITCLTKPTAQFSAQPLAGFAPLLVTFTDLSQGSYSDRSWNFGDGSTSAEANPTHEYQNPRVYTVSLTVSGAAGNDVMIKNDYITVSPAVVYPPPVAAFMASPLTGPKPLHVQFSNTSTGEVNSVKWEFGDGQSSTSFNPAHTYVSTGLYTVRLIATGPVESDTLIRSNYIQVTEDPANMVMVTIPSLSAGHGQPCAIPVNVANIPGKEIISYEFTLDFDPSVLSPVGISTVNTLSAPFSTPMINFSQSGKFQVGNSGITPLSQNGVLLNIIFDVIGTAGCTCDLSFSSFVFNSGSPAAMTSAGVFRVAGTTDIEAHSELAVAEFDLSAGYPNPFNSSVRFAIQVATPSAVKAYVMDRLGRTIRVLLSGPLAAGRHSITWDGKNDQGLCVPSGIYMVVSQFERCRKVAKVALVQ